MISWISGLLFLFAFSTSGQNTGTIDLLITSAKSDKGVIRILVFKSERGYPDRVDQAVKAFSLPIKEKKCRVEIKDLAEGNYAVTAFHDEDENGKINTNSVGFPIERYGFSNNVKGYFGPPDFKETAFFYEKGTKQIRINLR